MVIEKICNQTGERHRTGELNASKMSLFVLTQLECGWCWHTEPTFLLSVPSLFHSLSTSAVRKANVGSNSDPSQTSVTAVRSQCGLSHRLMDAWKQSVGAGVTPWLMHALPQSWAAPCNRYQAWFPQLRGKGLLMVPSPYKRSFSINLTPENNFLSTFVKFYPYITDRESSKPEDFRLKSWPFKHGKKRVAETCGQVLLEENHILWTLPTSRMQPAETPGS